MESGSLQPRLPSGKFMSNEYTPTDVTLIRGTLAWMDLVMANIDELIFVVDHNWEIVYANDTLVNILGALRVTMLGKQWWEVVPLEKDETPITSKLDFSGLDIKDVGRLNGVYQLKAFKVNRHLSLTASHVASVNQTVCVLADVTVEMNAYSAIKQKDEEISRLQQTLKD